MVIIVHNCIELVGYAAEEILVRKTSISIVEVLQ